MEAISHAGTVLGVLAKDGVVLAAEKRVTGKLLDLSSAKEGGGYGGSGEKMFLLNSCVPFKLFFMDKQPRADTRPVADRPTQKRNRWCRWDHVRCQLARQFCAVGGTETFAAVQRRYTCRITRTASLRHETRLYSIRWYVHARAHPLRSLHSSHFLGLRPFGVSLLYAGYDPHYRFQLYHSDPSGNYSGWKATCIGANSGTAQSLLKQEYKDDIGVDEAIGLVLRVMSRTMDSTTLGSEKRQSRSVSSVDHRTDPFDGRVM